AVTVSALTISAAGLAWRVFAADADPAGAWGAGVSGGEAAACISCGSFRSRSTFHPVLARSTVAASVYLSEIAALARAGDLLPAHVDEIEAMIRFTGDGDDGDAAVFAVRACGDLLVHGGIDADESERLAGILLEAASDPRPRVRRNALVQWGRLGQDGEDGVGM
ncbi:MAG TPA: hypothetical protein PKU91_10375, partial [Phycisphaerales bacterium]|nr:hypothetical protein [Phycisphaerales bacterium]